MRVRHTFHARGVCPANGLPDDYRIRVFTETMLPCERIVCAAEELLVRPVYQEEFTQALADRLGCEVRTRCLHLHGGRVSTDCICLPEG